MVWSLGLMSGTSLDGVDAALLRTDGEVIAEFGPSVSAPYRSEEVEWVAEVTRNWRLYRNPRSPEQARELTMAKMEVLCAHAAAVARLLAGTRARTRIPAPDLIGFHGQTIAHMPDAGWTWQLGDGAALARALNRPVVWDFRSSDVSAGGQGAPLAPFFHHALARYIGAAEPLVFLNIGGVANITWVDPLKEKPEEPGALLAFDTGPGNGLINDWMERKGAGPMDENGGAAARGRVHEAVLRSNFSAAYLEKKPPKSLDRHEFSAVLNAVKDFSVNDGAATLTAFTVHCVKEAMQHLPAAPHRWLVCGGGRRNRTMMRMLAEALPGRVEPVEAAGFDGDMIEAQAFAWLAVRSLRGLPISAPSTTGCGKPERGGVLSHP